MRRIANRLIDAAETGDRPSIRELIDCLDGKAAQVIHQGQMTVTQLSDSQLNEIAARIDRNEFSAKGTPGPAQACRMSGSAPLRTWLA